MTEKIIITEPGAYCTLKGRKVRVLGLGGGLICVDEPPEDDDPITSTWSARPRPAYRKDGTSRWPVGTKAVLVAWEGGSTDYTGDTITVFDAGPCWDNGYDGLVAKNTKGQRPLFRKLPDLKTVEPIEAHGGKLTAEDETFFAEETLMLWGKPGEFWAPAQCASDTHRLTLYIDKDGNIRGKREAV